MSDTNKQLKIKKLFGIFVFVVILFGVSYIIRNAIKADELVTPRAHTSGLRVKHIIDDSGNPIVAPLTVSYGLNPVQTTPLQSNPHSLYELEYLGVPIGEVALTFHDPVLKTSYQVMSADKKPIDALIFPKNTVLSVEQLILKKLSSTSDSSARSTLVSAPTISVNLPQSVTRGSTVELLISTTGDLSSNPSVYFTSTCDTTSLWKTALSSPTTSGFSASIPVPTSQGDSCKLRIVAQATSTLGDSVFYPENGLMSDPVTIPIQ